MNMLISIWYWIAGWFNGAHARTKAIKQMWQDGIISERTACSLMGIPYVEPKKVIQRVIEEKPAPQDKSAFMAEAVKKAKAGDAVSIEFKDGKMEFGQLAKGAIPGAIVFAKDNPHLSKMITNSTRLAIMNPNVEESANTLTQDNINLRIENQTLKFNLHSLKSENSDLLRTNRYLKEEVDRLSLRVADLLRDTSGDKKDDEAAGDPAEQEVTDGI
jgi:hypothetical protein